MNKTAPAEHSLLDISGFRTVFQDYLESFLDRKIAETTAHSEDPFINDLIGYPKNLLASGKRQRSYIALLMYQAGGGMKYLEALSTLVSLEVFHMFCLVHDDIIDRGTERRQIPTLHEYARAHLEAKKRLGDAARLGQSQAILVGDLLFAWSQDALMESSLPADRVSAARSIMSQMIREVVVGQMIDVDVTSRQEVSPELIEQKMYLKTASYTFVRPMLVGLRLATDEPDLDAFCQTFGRALGLAFQLQDDYLELVVDPEEFSKTSFSDLRERQHTYFTQYIREHGTVVEQATLKRFFGCDVTLDDREAIVNLFTDSGALASGLRLADTYFEQAEAALAEAALPANVRETLGDLVRYIRQRRT